MIDETYKFAVTTTTVEAIKKANVYSQLPIIIQDFFQRNKFMIDDDAFLIKEPAEEENNRWYLVDESEELLQVFFIEMTEDEQEREQDENTTEIDDAYENYIIAISCQTPTWSSNAYDYPIFRVGLPLLEEDYITGKERKKLKNKRQQIKWDYFFQASRERLTQHHNFLIRRFEANSQVYHSRGEHILTIGFIFFALSVFISLTSISLIVLVSLCFLLLCAAIAFLRSVRSKNLFLRLAQIIKNEKINLENQINWIPSSISQMEEWLEEELLELDAKAIKALKFSKKKIIRRELSQTEEVNFVDKDVLGLKIQEYGFTQPLETNGKRWIEKKYPRHLEAYTYHPNTPLVGVYYIHLIYMTPDSIGYSRFFYDFILAKPEGTITKQYYYKDIVSIGTKVTATEVFSDLEEWETKILKFSLSNPEVIEMGLTDKVAIENIRKIIDTRKEMEAEELSDELLESDTPDLDALLNTPADELPGTKVRFIEETVKTYWSLKKETTSVKK